MANYTVRCNKNPQPASGAYEAKIYDSLGKEVTTDIPINASTDFELTADYAKSDAAVRGFTIDVTPNPNNDIKNLKGGKTPTITFTDVCSSRATIQMNLVAYTSPNNSPTQITGGKPIIRNEPNRVVRVVLGVAVALVVLGVAYYFYAH